MHSVKEMFPDGINEILVFSEYDEDEVDGENCESDQGEFWIDILEYMDSLRLRFASIVMSKIYDTKVISLADVGQFFLLTISIS